LNHLVAPLASDLQWHLVRHAGEHARVLKNLPDVSVFSTNRAEANCRRQQAPVQGLLPVNRSRAADAERGLA
jgi:hypothetical protein